MLVMECASLAPAHAFFRHFWAEKPVVCLSALELLDVPVGSLVWLQAKAEESGWLNLNRPVLSRRKLKLIFWAHPVEIEFFRTHAPDFYDWFSHQEQVAAGAPSFTLWALKNGPGPGTSGEIPGFCWRGGDIQRVLKELGDEPVSSCDAQVPYPKLVEQAKQPGWRIWQGTRDFWDLERILWAEAEAGQHGVAERGGKEGLGRIEGRREGLGGAGMAGVGIGESGCCKRVDGAWEWNQGKDGEGRASGDRRSVREESGGVENDTRRS
jgi:hypothetical protein